MPAAPIPSDERRRLAALFQCGVLDTGPEAGFDDMTALAAELLRTPVALVSLVDRHRQWFKSRVGLEIAETPRDMAFCAYVILGHEPLVVPDATQDARFADNPLVTGEPGIRFYAGVPLRLASGEALGSLCVIDFEPRKVEPSDLAILERLGRQVASQLELRLANRRLEQAERAARAADAAKSAFLANMSHEIRTPMTAILGHADLLAEDGPDVDRRHLARAVASIRRNGRHLLALVNDVLDLSRIEAGRMTLESVPVSPVEVLADAVEIVRHAAREKELALEARFDGPIPERVETDPTRLRQVLVNLLGNAVKFTAHGSVTVRVTAVPAGDASGDDRLRFAVVDTGIGMTPEQRDRIARFEAFTQADAGTSRAYGGSGLGLRISHRLAELLGGELAVESEPGRGSTFTATIAPTVAAETRRLTPAEAETAFRRTVGDGPTPDAEGHGRPLAGRRVLLAEDGPDNQRLLRWIVERAGGEVTVVPDGRQAVDRLLGTAGAPPPESFDLLLLDMHMPELDGYGAIRALRTAGCGIATVAVTASVINGDEPTCIDAGCDAYATKPVDRPRFLAACEQALRAAESRLGANASDPPRADAAEPAGGDAEAPPRRDAA